MNSNNSQTKVFVSIGTCILVLILIGVLCRQIYIQKETTAENTKETFEEMITNYFNKEELKYSTLTYDDSIKVFYLNFDSKADIRVITFNDRQVYHIEGNLDLNGLITEQNKNAVIEEINKYNSEALIASSYLDTDGNIIFWVGHNCDDRAYSAECFEKDFRLVLRQVKLSTPDMLKKCGITPPDTTE